MLSGLKSLLGNLYPITIPINSIIISVINIIVTRIIQKATAKFDQEFDKAVENCNANSRRAEQLPFVSILVPARNEERNIVQCVTSILKQNYPNFELIAIDDNSTDQTPILLKMLLEDGRYNKQLRVVEATSPPAGWLGKDNALWCGYQQVNSDADWLLFVDADTILNPGALPGAVTYAIQHKFDLISLASNVFLENFWYDLLLPELGKLYLLTTVILRFRRPKPGSVEEASGNGAFILVRKAAYDVVSGHTAPNVRNSPIEDVEIARNFRRAGFTTAIISTYKYMAQRPGVGLKVFWRSFSKNWFLVAHKDWSMLARIVAFECLYVLPPFISSLIYLLNLGAKGKHKGFRQRLNLSLNLIAIGLMMISYGELLRSFNTARRYGVFYPLVVLIDLSLLINSALQFGVFRSVRWKDRDIMT